MQIDLSLTSDIAWSCEKHNDDVHTTIHDELFHHLCTVFNFIFITSSDTQGKTYLSMICSRFATTRRVFDRLCSGRTISSLAVNRTYRIPFTTKDLRSRVLSNRIVPFATSVQSSDLAMASGNTNPLLTVCLSTFLFVVVVVEVGTT